MIIVRHGSLAETASSLRNKKNKSDHQESKRTSIKFSHGSSHATVRDLSKHRPRNFDKLCDRAGGGLDFSSVQSEQMKIDLLVWMRLSHFPPLVVPASR